MLRAQQASRISRAQSPSRAKEWAGRRRQVHPSPPADRGAVSTSSGPPSARLPPYPTLGQQYVADRMGLPDVRRLAALDMWGSAGTMRRRRVIRAEFVVGALGCTILGLLALIRGSGWMLLVGTWLVGAGFNYIPLALHAQSLSGP